MATELFFCIFETENSNRGRPEIFAEHQAQSQAVKKQC